MRAAKSSRYPELAKYVVDRLEAAWSPVTFGTVPQAHCGSAMRRSISSFTSPGMTATLVIDGPMTRAWFEAWVARALAPTLKPGDVVILDNLPAHKSVAARDAIEARGARLLFLPPYSPDFNPIENAFAKLKALLRKAAARTVDDLSRAIGSAIDTFTPAECANYFAAAGYDAY